MEEERDKLLRVVDVDVYLTPPPYQVPVLHCELEDGRSFLLYHIPVDVMLGIMRLKGEEVYSDRETFFEIMSFFREDVLHLKSRIEMVVVDELDEATSLYNAKIVIRGDGFKIKKKMVPSHAIYLAYLIGVPVYVRSELVDQQTRRSETEEK